LKEKCKEPGNSIRNYDARDGENNVSLRNILELDERPELQADTNAEERARYAEEELNN